MYIHFFTEKTCKIPKWLFYKMLKYVTNTLQCIHYPGCKPGKLS